MGRWAFPRWRAEDSPDSVPARLGWDHSEVTNTVFEAVGGQAGMDALVDAFYDRVERDAVLRPLYPDDLADSRRHLALFLGQYFGGPATYSEQRGHPRLRMRHAHLSIGK